MYVSHTAAEHRTGLGLSEDYSVDGFLCYGTYNAAIIAAQLDATPNAEVRRLDHPFLQGVREVRIGQKALWATYTYGGAQLSELAHLASLFGSRTNILVGSCGGLKPNINTGDIIIPVSSFSQDSSAKLYHRDSDIHVADNVLSDKLTSSLTTQDVPVHRESLVTCQAMLGESWEDVELWSQQGYGGVEMEASTLFAVSSHFNVRSAALLYVGDNLIQKQTNLSPGFASQAEMRAERQKLLFSTAIAELIRSEV